MIKNHFFHEQAPGERNYHIFYEMMSGLTDQQKQKFGLTTVEEFAYLNQVQYLTFEMNESE